MGATRALADRFCFRSDRGPLTGLWRFDNRYLLALPTARGEVKRCVECSASGPHARWNRSSEPSRATHTHAFARELYQPVAARDVRAHQPGHGVSNSHSLVEEGTIGALLLGQQIARHDPETSEQ